MFSIFLICAGLLTIKQEFFFYGSNPPSTAKEDNTANQSLTNGFAEDKTNQDSNIKPSKRQKHSSEVCTF